MNPAELSQSLLDVVRRAVAERGADSEVDVKPEDVTLERPKNREHGDWASNVAMKLAKRLGVNPRELRGRARRASRRDAGHRRRRGRRPRLHQHHPRGRRRRRARPDDRRAGRRLRHAATLYDGVTINLEFVSANPTGPLHIGGTRWAAVGDSLARMLPGAGRTRHARVLLQRPRHRRSTASRAAWSRPTAASPRRRTATAAATSPRSPPGSSRDYPGDLAALPRDEQQEVFRELGVDLMFAEIKASLHDFGVDFDVYFHENDAARVGCRRARGRASARARPHLRGRRRDLAAHDRLRRRQRPRHHQERRRARLHLRRPRLLPQQARARLRAQHHHARRRPPRLRAAPHGDDGGVRRRAVRQPRDPDRPARQPRADGEPVRMSKRAGTVVTMEDLVGCGRRRRRALRPRAQLDRLAARHRPRPARASARTTTRSSTCSTRTPAPAPSRATRPTRASTARAFDASAAPHETESELLGVLAEFPRVVAAGRRAARAAPRRPLRRGARRRVPPLVRQLPGDPAGRRAGRRRAPHPPVAQRRDRPGAAQRARVCSA